ncbi:helix-turn-helix transcriptional regulator [Aerococcaceae bacterium DSM 111020]|nr:helix-turn-helix transcriptional regulator [Aerococcaceae bacterium DSM 111020]
MFQTTSNQQSSAHFLKEYIIPNKFQRYRQTLIINKNTTETLFQFEQQVHLASISGLGLLITTDDPNKLNHYQYHVLTENIILPKKMYFNVIALANICHINLTPFGSAKPKLLPTTKQIINPKVQPLFVIHQMYTMSVNEVTIGDTLKLTTSEEYRMIIVDHHEVILTLNKKKIRLKENDCLIIEPKQNYTIHGETLGTARLLTIYFSVENLPHHFTHQPLQLSHRVQRRLADFVDLVDHSQLSNQMSDLFSDKIINYFQGIIIDLLDTNFSEDSEALTVQPHHTPRRLNQDDDLFKQMIEYIDNHIEEDIKVSELVSEFNISRSTIQNLFQSYLEQTPKQYINALRLNRSKQLIRESSLSLTEIAEQLNFGTIQYFSRAFKNEFGITPSQYSKSIIP